MCAIVSIKIKKLNILGCLKADKGGRYCFFKDRNRGKTVI